MRISRNPFRPSFGSSPPVLAGRDELNDEFAIALDEGPGAIGRSLLISGARGMGKTVVLNELEDTAQQNGWIIVRVDTDSEMLKRLEKTVLPKLLKEYGPPQATRRITGVGITPLGSITTEVADKYPVEPDLELLAAQLAEALAAKGSGILLTVDEVQSIDPKQLHRLTSIYQNLIRDNHQIAFAAAGLPQGIHRLLTHPGTTFLRRAERIELGAVSPVEAEDAIRDTVVGAGREITAEATSLAAEISQGYPYLIQLVGHRSWNRSDGENPITATHVAQSQRYVIERIGLQVHQPAIRDLSVGDRDYLLAMSPDDGPTATSVIAQRLNKSMKHQSMYRQRLLNAELITVPHHGQVDFSLPYMREYLRSSRL